VHSPFLIKFDALEKRFSGGDKKKLLPLPLETEKYT
jgi:hypothetical protein